MPTPNAKASKPTTSSKNRASSEKSGPTVNPKTNEQQSGLKVSTSTATTVKTSPTKSNTIIGYVHHLSPSKRNKRDTMDYSTLALQTSASVIEEGLVYSKGKRPLLAESEKSRTPVKIKRCSYTSDGKKFIVNDITEVSVPNPTDYSFQFNEELKKKSPSLSVQSIVADADVGDYVNTRVKVLTVGTPSTLPGKNLKVAIAKVADNTGTIDLDLWENNISTVKEGKVYSVNSVQVRQWMGKKKLSTVFSSAFTLDSQDDIQASAEIQDQNDTTTTITIAKIHSVEKLERFLKCVKCARKVLQPSATLVVHCDRCRYFMRTADCEKRRYATIVVELDGKKPLFLTVFNEVLNKVVEDLETATDSRVCETLLLLDNISITYDNNSLIVSVIQTKEDLTIA